MKRAYTYLDDDQQYLIDSAAKVLGLSRADFLRTAALEKGRQVMGQDYVSISRREKKDGGS